MTSLGQVRITGKSYKLDLPEHDFSELPVSQGFEKEIFTQEGHGNLNTVREDHPAFGVTASNSTVQNNNALWAGLGIYNPIGSGKIIIPYFGSYYVSTGSGAVSVVGAVGLLNNEAPTGILTPQTPVALNGAAGVIPTVVLSFRGANLIRTPDWMTLNGLRRPSSGPFPTFYEFFEGMFGIMPGGFFGITSLQSVSGRAALAWYEMPI